MTTQANIVTKMDLAHRPPEDAARIIAVLQAVAAPLSGDEFLHNLVEQLGKLFQAKTAFIARRLDPNGTMLRGLAAWKDGKRREVWDYDAIGNPCHLVYQGEPVLIPCDIADQFEKKRDSGYQSFVGYPLKNPDGGVIGHIGVYSSKVLVDDDAWLEVCGLFAERAQAEILRSQFEFERDATIVRLKQLDDLKNEFISIAAHDLRGPLGVVRGIADMMMRMPLTDEKRNSLCEIIMTASDRMVGLVNGYLDMTATEAGALTVRRTLCDLNVLVAERVEIRKFTADELSLCIEVQKTELPTIMIDAERLGQALDNLLDNALKFAPKDSTVTVTTVRVDEVVEIVVADQGPGIPEDRRDAIFAPFECQGSAGDARNTNAIPRSFGLGLMITRRIVDAHEGEVLVGDAEGGGAAFTIRLPI